MQNFFTVFYLVAEYMRPQSMYEDLSAIPFGMIAVLGMGVAFIIKGDKAKLTSTQVHYAMVAFIIWFMISALFSMWKPYAIPLMLDFLKTAIIFYLLINLLNNRKYLYPFLIVFLLLGLKLAQYAVRVWVSNGFYSDPRGLFEGGGFATGFFSNPNDLGVLLNVLFGLGFYMYLYDDAKIWKRFPMKWFHGTIVLLTPIAILSTSSRAAALSLGCVVLVILLKSKRKIAGAVLAMVFVIGFISYIPNDNWARFEEMGAETDTTGQARITLWKLGIRMANEHPAIGVGPGNYKFMNYYVYRNGIVENPHNIFIQALSELGYPGLFILIGLIYFAFRNQRRVRDMIKSQKYNDRFYLGLSHGIDLALVAFVTNGFFLTVLYYPLLWTILVLSVSLRNIVTSQCQEYSTNSAKVKHFQYAK